MWTDLPRTRCAPFRRNWCDHNRLLERGSARASIVRKRSCGHPAFLIIVDEGPGSPKGTGALFRPTAVTPVNAEVQTVATMRVPPRQPLIQIKDRHERRTTPACRTGPETKTAAPASRLSASAGRSSDEKAKSALSGGPSSSGRFRSACNKNSRGYREAGIRRVLPESSPERSEG
jgi:hypothetical protein